MIFINTRPIIRARSLTRALESQNIKVIELPLLEMIPIDLNISDEEKLNNLLLNKYDVLIVVSPTAAELGYQVLQSRLLMNTSTGFTSINCPIVVVGEATAQVLNKYYIDTIIPEISNNEGILKIDCIENLDKNSRVMIWRGKGGRRLLIDDLLIRGTKVDIIELYQRRLPSNTVNSYQKWLLETKKAKNSKNIKTVLITSAESFNHWKNLITQGKQISNHPMLLDDFHYLVLGNRLSSILTEYNLSHQALENLKIPTILHYYRSQP